MTEIKTPPGTVPLFRKQNSKSVFKRCAGCRPDNSCEHCVYSGWRVIDQEAFDEFMRHEVFKHKMQAVYFEQVKGQLLPEKKGQTT